MLFEYFMSFPVERMLRFMCDNDEKPSRSCCCFVGSAGCATPGEAYHTELNWFLRGCVCVSLYCTTMAELRQKVMSVSEVARRHDAHTLPDVMNCSGASSDRFNGCKFTQMALLLLRSQLQY